MKNKKTICEVIIDGKRVKYDAIYHGKRKKAIRDYRACFTYLCSSRVHYKNDKRYDEKRPAHFFVRNDKPLSFSEEVNMIRKALRTSYRKFIDFTGKLLSSRMKRYLDKKGYKVTEDEIKGNKFRTTIEFNLRTCQCHMCCDDYLLLNPKDDGYYIEPCDYVEPHCYREECDECDYECKYQRRRRCSYDDGYILMGDYTCKSRRRCYSEPCDETALIDGEIVHYDKCYSSRLVDLLKWADEQGYKYIGSGHTYWDHGDKMVRNKIVHFFKKN